MLPLLLLKTAQKHPVVSPGSIDVALVGVIDEQQMRCATWL